MDGWMEDDDDPIVLMGSCFLNRCPNMFLRD